MDNLMIYLLQASISITVFYVFYELLFKKEAYFQFIRYYFISAVLISTILPLVQFSLVDIVESFQDYPIVISPVHNLVTYTLAEVTIRPEQNDSNIFSIIKYLDARSTTIIIYFTGVLFTSLILLYRLFHVVFMVLKGNIETINGIKIVHINGAPIFSFFNIVFLDKKKYLFVFTLRILTNSRLQLNPNYLLPISEWIHWDDVTIL